MEAPIKEKKITKEDLLKKNQELIQKTEILFAFDQVLTGVMSESISRMEKSAQMIREHITQILTASKTVDQVKDKIIEMMKFSNPRETESDALVQESQDLSTDIKTMLTLLKQIHILIARLKKTRKFVETLQKISNPSIGDKEIKALFIKYTSSLQLIWKECETLCEAYDETVMFNKIIYKKELAV